MKKQHLSFSKWALCFALSVGLGVTSCSDDKNYDDDIDKINKELANLKNAIEKIQASYVSNITAKDGKTLVVTMQDGTTKELTIEGATTSASVVTIGANGNWFIDGEDTGNSSKGAAGSVVTIGANGNWFIDGKDTGNSSTGTGSGTSTSSMTVVEKDTYFALTVKDGTTTKEYKLPKATTIVTSLEFVPTTVNTSDVKIIAFPVIVEDFYRNIGRNTTGTGIKDYIYNNTWGVTTGIQGISDYQLYSLNYPNDALVKYRVNPASVDRKAFTIAGFSLESANVVNTRAFKPTTALVITDSAYVATNEETLLTLKVKAPALPNAGSTTKTDLVALAVVNKNGLVNETTKQENLVYSEYIPAKRISYSADLVKRRKNNGADVTNSLTNRENAGYILNRTYQILHPTMTDTQANAYEPFVSIPKPGETGFLAAVTQVRNFTYRFDNANALVLSDSLDGIFDTHANAISASWIANNYFKDNKFDYTWKFEPVSFSKEGVNTSDRYLKLDTKTGKVTVKDPDPGYTVNGQETTLNYAAIDRLLVVRANLQDTSGKTMLSRIVLIHVVGESSTVPTGIIIKNQKILVPGCDAIGKLDVDAIYNHKTVAMGKDDFATKYPTFTQSAATTALGVTITDDRKNNNVMTVTNFSKLTPGKVYEFTGIYSGPGMAPVTVTWEFTVVRPTLDPVVKEKLLSYWQGNNVQATGTDSRILNPGQAWDEVAMLKNAFEKYATKYKLGTLDKDGKFVAGNCGEVDLELAFILLDPTTKTFEPYTNVEPTTTTGNWINRKYRNYFITHYTNGNDIQFNLPNYSVMDNGLLQYRFTNSELYYTYEGRSYVGYRRYGNDFEQARLVPVQAVAYLKGDFDYYIPLEFKSENGIDGTKAAKFYVDYHNPVQKIVGKDGKPVKGDVYLLDKDITHTADLSRLFAIQDFKGNYIYNYGATLTTGATNVNTPSKVDEDGNPVVIGVNAKWNMPLVKQYKVGYDLSSDRGTQGADSNNTFENNNSFYINPAKTTQETRARYELLGLVADDGSVRPLPGTSKIIINQGTGIAKWAVPGEDLQNIRYIRFQITVPNQWNWGEFDGTGATVDNVKYTFNTAQYISTTVNIPIVPMNQNPAK